MKKLIAMLMALVTVCCLFGCANTAAGNGTTTAATTAATTEATTTEATNEDDVIMTYQEYMDAEMDSEVTVTCWVQATQSWWDGTITVYAQDEDGAYFLYQMNCSEENAAKLVPGTLIKVTGTKGEWSGEIEIMDATFAFVADADEYIAKPVDLTAYLGTDKMINYQNQLASFTDLTVKSIAYKNDGGDDIYLTLTKDGKDYNFCVEVYLTGTESDVYKTVGSLAEGDKVDVEGFVYWYEGMNPHITAITKK